ncbi:MAG: element excision factor XisH family protein [Aggregatilineales bacterium]
MPAKDRYHDAVVHSLEKSGWRVIRENVVVGDEVRQLYIDILARRDSQQMILVEVKTFEDMQSPMTYLEKAIGQYMVYLAVLDFVGNNTPLYLAVSSDAYQTLFAETMVQHIIRHLKVKIVVFDPVKEEIIQWLT